MIRISAQIPHHCRLPTGISRPYLLTARNSPHRIPSPWSIRAHKLLRDKIAVPLDPEKHLHLRVEKMPDRVMFFCWLPSRAGDILNKSGQICKFARPYKAQPFDEALQHRREKNIRDFFSKVITPLLEQLELEQSDMLLFPRSVALPDFGLVGYFLYGLLKSGKCSEEEEDFLHERFEHYAHKVAEGPFGLPHQTD